MTMNNANHTRATDNTSLSIAILILEGMTAIDAIGPYEMLRGIPGATVQFVGETAGPKRTDTGMIAITADYTLDEVPYPDVLVVTPGLRIQSKERLLQWIRKAHKTTQWTTSVCAGALLLGEAGILQGKRATTYWYVMDQLAQFGAIPCPDERYVRDGKILTSAGLSAGLDMALYLAGLIAGDERAQVIQLAQKYDPLPPYNTGSLRSAPSHVETLARQLNQEIIAAAIART